MTPFPKNGFSGVLISVIRMLFFHSCAHSDIFFRKPQLDSIMANVVGYSMSWGTGVTVV